MCVVVLSIMFIFFESDIYIPLVRSSTTRPTLILHIESPPLLSRAFDFELEISETVDGLRNGEGLLLI